MARNQQHTTPPQAPAIGISAVSTARSANRPADPVRRVSLKKSRPTVARTCLLCGCDFLAVVDQVKIGGGKYCSRQCGRKGGGAVGGKLMHTLYKYSSRSNVDGRRVRDKKREHARYLVAKAIKAGTLRRLPCEECGATPSSAHHSDYDAPLDIVWLCHSHHHKRDIRDGTVSLICVKHAEPGAVFQFITT